jgi:hypothetical protein
MIEYMCKNMRELLEYSKNSRRKRAFQHYELNKVHGECSGLTDREWKNVKTKGKTSYTQSSKYTMHKMWRDNTQKYDLKQLKIINKA